MSAGPRPPGTGEPLPAAADTGLSLVRDDVLFRVQRAIGLIPRQGLGLLRRTAFYVAVAWLPLAAWAVWTRRALPGDIAEPLLAHYAIHAQLLLCLPVLILGEGFAHGITTRLVPQFVVSGVVRETDVGRFREVVQGLARLRSSGVPWLVIAVLVLVWFFVPRSLIPLHELTWAESGAQVGWGFGGWWYVYVSRPIFQIFAFAWLWRVVLLAVLFRRIARLDLQLAPCHPDRTGGLGFTADFPRMFAPLAFASSTLLSARWAHEVVYHGAHVKSYATLAAVFAGTLLIVCLAPLLLFAPRLAQVRRRALLDYGALVGEHGRLVHRRWIAREAMSQPPLLAAPEIGPSADVAALYQAVERMRTLPLGKSVIATLAMAVAIPLACLFAIEIPVGEMLGKILKGLL